MLPTSKGSECSPLSVAQTSLDPFRTLARALLRRPGDYEPMDCLCIYVLVCFHVSMCLSVPFWLCICLCDCVSENVFVCVCLCPCTVVGASLGLTLRGRGLPVHVYHPVALWDQWYPVELSLVVAVVHPTKHHHTALLLISVERSGGGDLGGQ